VAILVEGRILLFRRLRAPEAGHWGIPGGKIDLYETAPQAAEREISEELGIRVTADDLLCFVDQIQREAGTHWVSPVYLARTFTGEPRILEPDKHTDLGCYDLQAPPQPLTAAAAAAMRALAVRAQQ
jgi:8-oxo-dGTP diphosphatase